jgi:micrococcal nuclease
MYEYACKVVRVVDGDTVDVDIDLGFDVVLRKQRIRLYGVDTPESRTRDKEEKKYGLYAKQWLKNALGKNAIIRTKKDGRGKFGRILGEFVIYDPVYDQETTVNSVMIRDHIAVEYHGQSKEEIQEQHIKNREFLDI